MPGASKRKRQKQGIADKHEKQKGEGPELKGTQGDPDIAVRHRASGIFWVLIETRVNLGVGTIQGHFHTVSTKTFFSPDTHRDAPLCRPKPE